MDDNTGAVSAHLAGEITPLYQPPAPHFDEMLDANGAIRPAWSRLARSLNTGGTSGLVRRTEETQHFLRENGVTYNVYGAAKDLERPWELDPVPLMFSVNQWNPLADAIAQRARLLNRILQDVYGNQDLLRSGVLPPNAFFEHPGYLLPCVGIQPPAGIFLHWYAAQLARDLSGNWIALGDRSQGPSGAGYAVENRIVVSRTLPEEFQEQNVVRLASFFISLQNTLASLARNHRENPRVVLLSPGPRSSRYFEDVYLSRYLGYTLVEGGDLTVRGDGVYLKTLGGLLGVDVIFRRIGDGRCDPLELRPDSPAGVPGLLQVIRDGQVVVANALGGGFLEAPLLQAYLPSACRFLLGEELKLPSIRTWWCGRSDDLKYVEAHLDQLVIRPAFRHHNVKVHIGANLTDEERARLIADMRTRPSQYVAQEPVVGSTAPVWSGDRLQPWHVTLRAFAVATDGDYQVMPGGLSRVAMRSETLNESMAAGQRSKDVWVLADGPVEPVSLLRPKQTALELRRSSNDLPSRAADHLFWLGRLIERTEAKVRHARCVVARMTTELQPARLTDLKRIVLAMDEPGESPLSKVPVDEARLGQTLIDSVWLYLHDPHRTYGLLETIDAAQRTASVVRDRISVDGWRIINQLDFPPSHSATAMRTSSDLAGALAPLNQLLTWLSAFSGLCNDSMTRGPGWRFLDIGRRIERALQTLRVIRGLLVDAQTDVLPRLEAMLEIADSSMTYRYRYLTTLQLAPVLDLVLADESNPRAVGFQLMALSEHVGSLARDESDIVRTAEQKLVLSAQATLRLADVESFCTVNGTNDRQELDEFLSGLASELRALSDSISHTYLTHTVDSRQLEAQLQIPRRA
ncbi:circularly permuted type 2 ATP-grasp protein [Schlesneria paludicola]|uniref:circularly permuted type 2 ATP-grasp protein n=1 Tax=Schlesneria paludicola TaxID=360056 RepID=UPI00029B15AB|nr:circularly permuted type 2 ATP-grasp protein [Schlesneria paludicola]